MNKTFAANKGDMMYEHSGDHFLQFFAKAGSLYTSKQTFYDNPSNGLDLFKNCWFSDKITSMKLLMWLRNCRGGAGNRSLSREIINWIAKNDSQWVASNIDFIAKYGRFDDLEVLYDTPVEDVALKFWKNAIEVQKNGLAAKWADRKDNKLRKSMKMTPKDFRKLLVSLSKTVEQKMCARLFSEIEYSHVPSKAMANYTKAFKKNDEAGFAKYKESLANGETKINASVLFPHDCVNTAFNGDGQIAKQQFLALPNYISTGKNILAMPDFSGSMGTIIYGKTSALVASIGLALYCSRNSNPDSVFHNTFLSFSDSPFLVNWDIKDDFSETLHHIQQENCQMGTTNIEAAFNLILSTAKTFKLKQNQMPDYLLILSDMQFDVAVSTNPKPSQQKRNQYSYGYDPVVKSENANSVIDNFRDKFVEAGYVLPKIIFWDLTGYTGAVSNKDEKNVALVSGFSPSVLKCVLSDTLENITPMQVMLDTIEKYEVVVP